MKKDTTGSNGRNRRRVPDMRDILWRLTTCTCCAALLIGTTPMPLLAQAPMPASAAADDSSSTAYTIEQLDALLAPIALYPDQLLAQVLMAATFPLEVVDAARWIDNSANRALTGDALTRALAQQSWDPSVKSLVPFSQVLTMMNDHLDWLQQVGYAMTVQQGMVWDSVQRLRRQAQANQQLTTTTQQVVRTEGQAIVIEPAQPNVVFVPAYNPTVVFGSWPYPAYPPVFLPPPPAYYPGSALMAGLAFGAGVAITAGLWGWARPSWGYGGGGFGNSYTNVNVNRFNTINVNRPPIHNGNWRPGGGAYRPGGGGFRPPQAGPVGRPGRPGGGLPANGIGRPNVSVPGGAVRPPGGVGPGNRPPINQGGVNRPGGGPGVGQPGRPGGGQGVGQPGRPGGGQGVGQPGRPGGGQGMTRPGGGQTNRPNAGQGGGRSPPAFSGSREGRSAAQYGNRGAQSRQSAAPQRGGGGGGGGVARGGGGRGGGGGGGRGGGGGGGGGQHRR